MPNTKYLAYQTQKTPPIRCFICAKFLPFVSVPLQICNGTDTNAKPKNTILFDFSLSSYLFIWFFLSLLRICLFLPSSQPVFFLFSQSNASKKKATQKKAVVVAKRGGKAVATSLKSATAAVASDSLMVVDGFVGFAMVVIDGGRWVCHGDESLSWVHRWW